MLIQSSKCNLVSEFRLTEKILEHYAVLESAIILLFPLASNSEIHDPVLAIVSTLA